MNAEGWDKPDQHPVLSLLNSTVFCHFSLLVSQCCSSKWQPALQYSILLHMRVKLRECVCVSVKNNLAAWLQTLKSSLLSQQQVLAATVSMCSLTGGKSHDWWKHFDFVSCLVNSSDTDVSQGSWLCTHGLCFSIGPLCRVSKVLVSCGCWGFFILQPVWESLEPLRFVPALCFC